MSPILILLAASPASAAPPVADARCHLLVRLVDSTRVDLVDVGTGIVRTVVEGVALDATGLRGLARLEDAAAAVSGTATESATLVLPGAHTAASDRGDILTAFHSSAAIRRWSVADGSYISSMYLEGVDVPIWGMSVVGDVLYVLDDGRKEDGTRAAPDVLAFDIRDGALLTAIPLPDRAEESPRGLVCAAP